MLVLGMRLAIACQCRWSVYNQRLYPTRKWATITPEVVRLHGAVKGWAWWWTNHGDPEDEVVWNGMSRLQ